MGCEKQKDRRWLKSKEEQLNTKPQTVKLSAMVAIDAVSWMVVDVLPLDHSNHAKSEVH